MRPFVIELQNSLKTAALLEKRSREHRSRACCNSHCERAKLIKVVGRKFHYQERQNRNQNRYQTNKRKALVSGSFDENKPSKRNHQSNPTKRITNRKSCVSEIPKHRSEQ